MRDWAGKYRGHVFLDDVEVHQANVKITVNGTWNINGITNAPGAPKKMSGAWIATSPVIDGLGFPLGTRIQTFYLEPRHPNALVPGKRPRTTLSPTLVLRG